MPRMRFHRLGITRPIRMTRQTCRLMRINTARDAIIDTFTRTLIRVATLHRRCRGGWRRCWGGVEGGFGFDGADGGFVLPGFVFPGLLFPGLLFPGGVLPGVVLPGVVLPGLELPGVVLPGLVFSGGVLPGVVLPGVVFEGGVVSDGGSVDGGVVDGESVDAGGSVDTGGSADGGVIDGVVGSANASVFTASSVGTPNKPNFACQPPTHAVPEFVQPLNASPHPEREHVRGP